MSFQTYSSRYNFFVKWRNVQLCMWINFFSKNFIYCPWCSRNNSISGATSLKALRKESLSMPIFKKKISWRLLGKISKLWVLHKNSVALVFWLQMLIIISPSLSSLDKIRIFARIPSYYRMYFFFDKTELKTPTKRPYFYFI